MKLADTALSLTSESEFAHLGFGIYDLELVWSLDLGAWSFPHEDRPW
jgi:hypothetical protein